MMREDEPRGAVAAVGAMLLDLAGYIGGLSLLAGKTARSAVVGWNRVHPTSGAGAAAVQLVRVGVRSMGVVMLVQFFVGVILALQMAPPLEPFGHTAMVANVIGVAVFRELAPLLSAVVLSGFAGASIAAEIGTMVVGEEIEALEAHAIPPVRFLVVPRVAATVVAMVGLTVLSVIAGCAGGYVGCLAALGPDAYQGYWVRIAQQVTAMDFLTGLIKAAIFGLVLALLACHEGLKVRGGAVGVGKATTMTVVYTIVALVVVDCVFTVLFYVYEL